MKQWCQMNELTNAALFRELAIFECGSEECVKNKAIALTKKKYHLFHYIVSGKGTLVLNKKEYHLSKGSIFFIPLDTDAIYFPDKDDPWHYIWVGFDGELIRKGLLAKLDIDIDNPIINDTQKNFKPYFIKMINENNRSGFKDIHMLGSLYQLFGEMVYQKEGKVNVSSNRVTIDLAKNFIYNNYQFDISVLDIAKNANVTPNYLSTIFQKEEKMTTKKFLTMVRMKKAKELLVNGNFKIKEVGEMVGYSNQLHFSSEFRKYYGESPMHYIKEVKDQ